MYRSHHRPHKRNPPPRALRTKPSEREAPNSEGARRHPLAPAGFSQAQATHGGGRTFDGGTPTWHADHWIWTPPSPLALSSSSASNFSRENVRCIKCNRDGRFAVLTLSAGTFLQPAWLAGRRGMFDFPGRVWARLDASRVSRWYHDAQGSLRLICGRVHTDGHGCSMFPGADQRIVSTLRAAS